MQEANSPDDRGRAPGRRRASVLPFVVLLLGIACSVLVWTVLVDLEDQLADSEFDADARERVLVVEEQFAETNAALQDVGSLYAISGDVSPEQFMLFVDPILERTESLQALSWNPVIRHEDRAAHEDAIREAGRPGYEVTERDASGELVRAGDRDSYVVVTAIEPIDGNEEAIGFDVHSEPTRRDALEAARDSGQFAVAMPVELVQSFDDDSIGALGFLPRYRPGAPTSTVEERRANLVGFFVAVVDVGAAVDAALDKLGSSGIDLAVVGSIGTPDARVLYDTEGETSTPADLVDVARGGPAGLESTTSITWGGEEIGLFFSATDAYARQFRTLAPLVALLGGLIVTLLLAMFVRSLQDRTARIQSEVADRTQELRTAYRELEAEMALRADAERALEAHREDLERQVRDRTSELEYTSNRLRTILESEPECVKLLNREGELVDMNAAGLAMIEADSFEQVKGLCVYDLVSDVDRAAFIALNERVMAGESGTLEFELNGLKGSRRRLETHAVPFFSVAGHPPHHLAITRDVTERRRVERERAALEAQLRQAQKLESVGVLAGGIAHDFNNFLQVIIGNIERAAESGDRDVVAPLEASKAAALEAARLCDQMLTYAGESRPEIRSVSLPRIVRSMVGLLDASHSKKVTLDITLDDDSGAIQGDDGQLGQVVLNLVTNASEAIGDETGRVRVSVTAETVQDPQAMEGWWHDGAPCPGRYVALVVADSGDGIDADVIDRIFDPFFTTKFAGRGLGLSSTLGIVQSHSGFLNVITSSGTGSTFRVFFPVSQEPVAPQVARPADDGAAFEGTILVVDDDDRVRALSCDLFESLGFRVLSASDGEEAVQTFTQHAPEIDLAVLDVTMPKLDGNEACSLMRRTRPDLPVIFCSGYADDVASRSMTGSGFTGFLHKPYRRADVLEVLRQAERHAVETVDAGR